MTNRDEVIKWNEQHGHIIDELGAAQAQMAASGIETIAAIEGGADPEHRSYRLRITGEHAAAVRRLTEYARSLPGIPYPPADEHWQRVLIEWGEGAATCSLGCGRDSPQLILAGCARLGVGTEAMKATNRAIQQLLP